MARAIVAVVVVVMIVISMFGVGGSPIIRSIGARDPRSRALAADERSGEIAIPSAAPSHGQYAGAVSVADARLARGGRGRDRAQRHAVAGPQDPGDRLDRDRSALLPSSDGLPGDDRAVDPQAPRPVTQLRPRCHCHLLTLRVAVRLGLSEPSSINHNQKVTHPSPACKIKNDGGIAFLYLKHPEDLLS